MPAFSKADKERIRAAVKAHAEAGRNLSISAYAKAAGIKRESVKPFLAELGLPVISTPGLAHDPDTGGEASATPAESTDESPSNPIPVPSAETLSVEAARLVAEVRRLPPAIASAVTEALNQRLPARGKDATSQAAAAATKAVTSAHIENVTETAVEVDTFDKEAGQRVREWWRGHGMSAEFPGGPADMVNVALTFWWANRGEVSRLRSDLEEAEAEVDDLRRQLDPELRRLAQTNNVWGIITLAAMGGHPIPRAEIAYLLRVAQAIADGAELPSELAGPPRLETPGGMAWTP